LSATAFGRLVGSGRRWVAEEVRVHLVVMLEVVVEAQQATRDQKHCVLRFRPETVCVHLAGEVEGLELSIYKDRIRRRMAVEVGSTVLVLAALAMVVAEGEVVVRQWVEERSTQAAVVVVVGVHLLVQGVHELGKLLVAGERDRMAFERMAVA